MDSFLKQALRGQKYTTIALLEEGSERRYTRIRAEKGESWILARSPLDQQRYFLWRWADFLKAGLHVPRIKLKDTKKGLLLMEDLGDQSLEKEVQENKTFPFSHYFLSLNQLIQIQKRGVHLFQAGPKPLAWTQRDMLEEMLYTEKYLIKQFLHYSYEQQSACLKEWGAICDKLASFPLLPGHRDFHSRNLFIKNQKVYMIDFQDAGLFPRFYDAVSLIYDVYMDSYMDKRVREKLMDYYLSKSGFKESAEELREELRLTALQRLFKAVGRFAGFYCIKKQKTHLRYIYPALKMQERLLCLLQPEPLSKKEPQSHYPAFLNLIQGLLETSRIMEDE